MTLIMKRSIKVLLCCILAFFSLSALAKEEIIPINIHKPPVYNGEKRAPVLIPILSYYDLIVKY